MNTEIGISGEGRVVITTERLKPESKAWLVAITVGLLFAWAPIWAMLFKGPAVIIRQLTGDSYHYLTIARKAQLSHIYTYDGVHVTNGFHPLWEYFLRAMFYLLNLQTHDAQAIAAMTAALIATTLGIILAGKAVIRLHESIFSCALTGSRTVLYVDRRSC